MKFHGNGRKTISITILKLQFFLHKYIGSTVILIIIGMSTKPFFKYRIRDVFILFELCNKILLYPILFAKLIAVSINCCPIPKPLCDFAKNNLFNSAEELSRCKILLDFVLQQCQLLENRSCSQLPKNNYHHFYYNGFLYPIK